MTKIMDITALTTDAEIDAALPFSDMRIHARERRDDAKAPYDATGNAETVLEVHDIDGVTVLWSPAWAYAYVNQKSPGIGDSLLIDNDGAASPEDAAARWYS